MLFDVAAVLTSVALGPVAEAFGVHEIATYSVSQSLTIDAAPVSSGPLDVDPAAYVPDAQPLPLIGPESDGVATSRVQGVQLLQQLSSLSSSRIAKYVTANPQAVARLLASPPPATDVTRWWVGLDATHQVNLRNASPQLVGNLDGIPYSVRDSANRLVLRSTIAELKAQISSQSGRTLVDNAKQQLSMVQAISAALKSGGSGPAHSLLSLDVTGQGRASIVIGDLSTADYVSYLVPGMFFTIENQMGDWVDTASRLHDEQVSWLALTGGGSATASANPTVATVAWIGYHTPNLTNIGSTASAYEGRDALASTIEGLQELRGADEPYVSVIAHSYGSTAALMALTDDDFQIDALAMVGSPGSPAKSVIELHVRDANVFVGEAAWDPVPNSSYFGSDPGSAAYGAKSMGVAGRVDPITHQVLAGSLGHIEYFVPGSEAMRNFALISIGEGRYVTSGSGN